MQIGQEPVTHNIIISGDVREVSIHDAIDELHSKLHRNESQKSWSDSSHFYSDLLIIGIWAFFLFIVLSSLSGFLIVFFITIAPHFVVHAVLILTLLFFLVGIIIPILLFRSSYYSSTLGKSKVNSMINELKTMKDGVPLGISYKHKIDMTNYIESNNAYKMMQLTKKVVEVGEDAPISIDYLHEPNYNVLNIGSSGFGKSVTSTTFAVRAFLNHNVRFLIIDYNGEYEQFAEQANLTIWHAGKDFKINLFKLNGLSPEERASMAADSLVTCAELTSLQATKVKAVVMKYYKDKKIPKLLNVFIDLSKSSKNELICQRLRAIQRVVGKEPKEFWDNLLNSNNVINLSGLNESEKELAVHTILERIYELFNRQQELNSSLRLLILVDEAWRTTQTKRFESKDYEPLISRIARQGRKYGFGILFATQQLSDAPLAFINSSAIKIIHNYQDSDTLNSIARLFKLSVFESAYIENAGIGEALLIDKGRRIKRSQWWNDYVKVVPLDDEEIKRAASMNKKFVPNPIDEPSMPIDEYEAQLNP
ncbi:MAG: ATP-binding protein [Candidatus Micrarchaeia archaeon]